MKLFTNIGEVLTLSQAMESEGRLVREQDLTLVKDAVMVCNEGKVVWIGAKNKFKPANFKKIKKEINLDGRAIIPGLVECHTHLIYAGSRAREFEMRLLGMSYQDIAKQGGGILSTVRATRKSRDLKGLAQARVDEFARQGVTTLEVKSGYGLDIEFELKLLKIAAKLKGPRIVPTCLAPHAIPLGVSSDEYLDSIVKKLFPKLKAGFCNRVDIFIDQGYFTLEQAERYFRAAKDRGLTISAHADQLSRSGASELAARMGVQSVDHVLNISDDDIKVLSNSQTTSVLLPGADFYLKVPYPQARKLIDSGARVALATDYNPGTCPSQDISWMGCLARLEMKMTWPEVIAAYTVGAAYALGLEKSVGSLEVGKECDFAVLDGGFDELFYSVGRSPVVGTYRSGKKIHGKQKQNKNN